MHICHVCDGLYASRRVKATLRYRFKTLNRKPRPRSQSYIGPTTVGPDINASISKKTGLLSLMGERLQHIFSHDAILLLRNAFAIPKLLYLLRTSSCFLSTTLQCYDDELRKILCSIMNICLSEAAWTQATLPVGLGALAFRVLYTALRTLSTRSYHHVSFQQTFLTKTKLSFVVTGPSTISSSGQSIFFPKGMGHSKGRGSLCSFVRPSL